MRRDLVMLLEVLAAVYFGVGITAIVVVVVREIAQNPYRKGV